MSRFSSWPRWIVGIVGAFFLLSAGAKTVSPERFVSIINFLGVGGAWTLLPGLINASEVALGLWMILSSLGLTRFPKACVITAMAYLVGMMIAMIYLQNLGVRGDCGCMGALSMDMGVAMWRNFGLVVVLAFAVSESGTALGNFGWRLGSGGRLTAFVLVLPCMIVPSIASYRGLTALKRVADGRRVIQVRQGCRTCETLLRYIANRPDLFDQLIFVGDTQTVSLPAGARVAPVALAPFPVTPAMVDFQTDGRARIARGGLQIAVSLGINPALPTPTVMAAGGPATR